MRKEFFISVIIASIFAFQGGFKLDAQTVERIPFGDFNEWVTRSIRESVVIGGHNRTLYEVGPETEITEPVPYKNIGDSPWGSSNVFSKISGVIKASNTVYPHRRSHDDICAKLCTKLETIKVLGVIDINYLVAGSLFFGEVVEPITDFNHPYSKIDMGVRYEKKPKYLTLDYMLDVPFTESRIRATGFGQDREIEERDNATIYILLQNRWEDEDGNIHASRVGTGGEIFRDGTEWVNNHKIEIKYGDCSNDSTLSWLPLRNGDNAFYAYNSKNELVKIIEEEWASEDVNPTHAILMIRSSDDELHTGSEGTVFYVDNISFEF